MLSVSIDTGEEKKSGLRQICRAELFQLPLPSYLSSHSLRFGKMDGMFGQITGAILDPAVKV